MVNLPAYLSGPEQWKVFWSFNADRGADLGSVWLVIAQAARHGFAVDTINLCRGSSSAPGAWASW